ncbi:hypothetical protein ACFC01_17975 [Streptomyces mirabilis]|uniref:hypothetical protein n=1 Tax=Streptomyces mirabilis TaxID=68239 RepID=UPI0035E1F743
MTDQPRKRITIDAPDGPTILAARHLDPTEGRVQIGSTVDTATRSAITRVLGYIAKAHGSAGVPASTAPLAAGLPLVRGNCPACGRASLFLGDGGYVTCSIIDCPNPSAADDMLHGGPPATEPCAGRPCSGTGCSHEQAADELAAHDQATGLYQAASGPAATGATEPGDIQLTRHLGRGLVVDQAPPRIRMALHVLSTAQYGAALQEPDLINIGEQVLYRVTGYDPEHAALLLDLVEDWRPAPTATVTEAEYEELKARWLATYGNNQGAHPVTVLRPTSEEQQP